VGSLELRHLRLDLICACTLLFGTVDACVRRRPTCLFEVNNVAVRRVRSHKLFVQQSRYTELE